MPRSNWSNNTIEERDSLTILRKEKAPIQQEYIDELFIEGNDQPENEIQLIDQMEILRQTQEEVKVQIPKINRISKNDKFTIRGKPKSPLSVEYLDYLSIVVDQSIINKRRQYKMSERDELKIPAEIKEPSQVEYIDELFISGEEKPKNEIQLIDQMEILKEEKPESQEKLHKPKGIPSPQILQVEERDSILIKPNNKLPLQMEYIDEMKIESELKPQNEIQIVDQMIILKSDEKDLDEEEKEITINISSNKKETKSKPKEENQPKDKVKLILIKEYIDELNIKGMESPNNEIQIVDQMLINRAYDKNKNISQNTLIEENYIIHPKSPLPQSPNEIQNIDQMVILPIPRKNLIIQNIDRLDIPRDYDKYQYIMESRMDISKDVRASGRPIHALGKETGLECQDIDNFEILGPIISQNLELEYINSIEIIERNKTDNNNLLNNWNDLEIEFVEDFKLDRDNNEVRGNRNYISASLNMRNNNNNNGNDGSQGGGHGFGNFDNHGNQGGHGSSGYHGNQGSQGGHGSSGYHGNQGSQGGRGNYGYHGNQGNRDNQDRNNNKRDDHSGNYGNQGNRAGRINLGNVNSINIENNREEINTNINTNINQISQSNSTVIRRNIDNNININKKGKIINDVSGIIIRTLEIENVNQFEIIGNGLEHNIEIERILETERKRILEEERIRIYELERQRISNLQIQRINELHVIDNAQNINTNINLNNNNRSSNINTNMNMNLISNNNNINSINNNILNNMQNNKKNQIRISSMENNINYEEANKNANISSFEPEKEKYIRNKYTIGEIEKEKIKHSWNEVNNIQQTSKLVIYSKRNSNSYLRESGRSSWNEKNRQQGIVNLSVIDDNKKVMEKNKDVELKKENNDDNLGINFNDRNLQSSSRPNRNNNNDYDMDGLDINNNMNNKFDKNIENKEEIEEGQKEDQKDEKISIGSKRSKKSKNSGDINDKNKPSNKSSPKEQQLYYQYNTNQSIYSSKNSNKNIITNNNNNNSNNNNNKPQSSSSKLFSKDSLQGNKIKINLNNNIEDKLKPSSSINYNINDKNPMKKNVAININSKRTQAKPSGLTYVIDNISNKKEDINNNNNKEKKSYQPINSNFPKLRTYERDSNPKFVSQSQNIMPTGKMKRKTKEKRFEYVREPNQSQNFQ